MSTSTPLLDFKSATLYAVRLVLQPAEAEPLLAALRQRLEDTGDFFEGEPVVIDALALETPTVWHDIATLLQQAGMFVVGIAAPEAMQANIRRAGYATVSLPTARDAAANREPVPPPISSAESVHRDPPGAKAPPTPPRAPVPQPAEIVAEAGVADTAPLVAIPNPEGPRATRVLDRGLRSGQKVYARGADLVVVGLVSPGAEIIADGNIHVYGALRGKAMAGARGDESARIFTTRLDAELVAVAGVYRVVDTELPPDLKERPAEVRLHAGALSITPLAV